MLTNKTAPVNGQTPRAPLYLLSRGIQDVVNKEVKKMQFYSIMFLKAH